MFFVFKITVTNDAGASATAAPKYLNPFIFADGATRILMAYKNNRIAGKVSTHAMALASPVRKKFVSLPFRQQASNDRGVANRLEKPSTTKSEGSESTTEPADELDFTENLAEALLILLNITHLRFTGITSTPPLNILSKVTILCDEYNCVHLVQPWLSQ
jgi:hypothetical protein